MTAARLWILALLLALVPQVPGACCSVPVFRYALDHWHADSYRLELAARDAADPEVARFARNLGAHSGLNLEIQRLAAENDAPSRLLRPPLGNDAAVPAWTGSVSAESLGMLTNSPARAEIISRILKGNSAVWVLVEGPDARANDAAAALLEKRLRYLEKVVQLPAIDPNDPSSKLGPGPALKIEFSLLRVPHNATAESPLRAMLAGPRSGLEQSDQAWIAAVFGRGRVLGAWPAVTMDDAAIEEVALFLVGACSCQVKRQNPGWDLLLQFDWDEKLTAMGIPALPDPAEPQPTQKNASPAPTPAPPSETPAESVPQPAQPRNHAAQPESVSIRIPEPEKPEPKKRTGFPVPAILVGLTLVFLFAGKYRRSSR
jgi:hypothetical protein